jgi:hypothetical protein
MPWCESCSKYLAPPDITKEGTCPVCGRTVDPVHANTLDLKQIAGDDTGVPWHFTLLVVLLVAYLGWRVLALFL